jgi:signal peptidase I
MLNQDPFAVDGSDDAVTLGPAADATYSHRGLGEVDPWADPTPTGRRALNKSLRGLTEILEVVALALIMFMGVRMVVHNYVVDGSSMDPTFADGQLVIVNRMAYRSFDFSWIPGIDGDEWRPFGQPDRGDIVVFKYQRNPPRDFIKRVIGTPGDEISVSDGRVYLNGTPLDEDYIAAPPNGEFGPEIVPEDHVFVMGDNRNNSLDSRSFGMVEQSEIIGRAEVRYWPLNQATVIDHHIGSPVLSVEVISSWLIRPPIPR